MGGILQPILALLLVSMREGSVGAEAAPDIPSTLLGLGAYLLLVAGTSRISVTRFLAAGTQGHFRPSSRLQALQFASFALFIWATDWVGLVRTEITTLPMLSTLVGLIPFIVAHGLRALFNYDALPEERKGAGKRRAAVIFQLRVLAIPMLPLLIMNGLRWAVILDDHLGRLVEAYLPLMILLLLCTVVAVFSVAPLLVRWIIFARPMKAGPLRGRLDAYCERIGFRPTNILVWDTGGTVSNALFIGILPFLRYVVVTDALIERLKESEVEAVFAHECGHGRRRHTQLYLVFVASFTMVMMLLQQEMAFILAPVIPQFVGGFLLVFYLLCMALFFLVFGWMSRRFETEADIFAVKTLEHPDAFPSALKTVGLHAGVLSRRGGMRHFGIGKRIGLLNRYLSEPEFKQSFDRLLLSCRQAIFLLLLIGVLIMVITGPRLMRDGHLRHGSLILRDAQLAKDVRLAAVAFAVLEPLYTDPDYGSDAARGAMQCLWMMGMDALGQGNLKQARTYLAGMKTDLIASDALSDFNRRLLAALLDTLAGKGSPGELASLENALARLNDTMPGLDRDSVLDDFSDIYLMQLARRITGASPRHPEGLSATAKLVELFRAGRREAASSGLRLRALVHKAEKEGVYRRRLFEMATGHESPRAAVRDLLGQQEER